MALHCKKTNSWIRLKGSDNYDSLRGSGLDLIIWDEIADVKPEAFDTIEPALADSPNHKVLYIGTPKGLNWFHDFALKGDHNDLVNDFGKPIKPHENWMYWHFTSYDNLSWPEGSRERKAFVDYINEKKEEAKPAPEAVNTENLDELMDEKLEKRELNSLDISDELKEEVGAYAKLNKVSVKKAMESPYIKFRLEEAGGEETTEEASIDGGSKTATVKKNTKEIDPTKLDLTTDEGKKQYKEWEEQTRKALG